MRRIAILGILMTLYFCNASLAQLSGTYTINSALPASLTNYQNFRSTINDLLGAARTDGGPNHGSGGVSGPVTFNVAAGGIYNEQITIPSITGTSATNRITYKGNGSTIAFASNNSGARAVIRLNGAKYITFENLKINAIGGTYGYGIHLTGIAEYNVIDKCTILTDSTFVSTTATAANYAGIVASPNSAFGFPYTLNSANNCTISNSIIVGGSRGVQIDGGGYSASGPYVPANHSRGMRVINNIIRGFFSFGIAFNMTDSLVLSGNDIHRKFRKDATSYMYCIHSGYDNYNYLIEKNRMHDLATSMINFQLNGQLFDSEVGGIQMRMLQKDVPKNGSIINNLIYNLGEDQLPTMKTRGIDLWFADINTNSGFINKYNIANNTIVFKCHIPSGKNFIAIRIINGTQSAPLSPPGFKNIQNNLISISNPLGTGRMLGLYYHVPDNGVNSNNNLFDIDTLQSCVGTYIGNGGAYFQSLYDWKRLAKFTNGTNPTIIFDQNSVDHKPFFKDPANGDFTPQNILVKNAGANLFSSGLVTTDINGVARDANPTIGAFEAEENATDAAISIVKSGEIRLCGNEQVKVRLMNNGTTIINTANISWSVNGLAQTPASLSGLSLASGASAQVVLGNYNFSSSDVSFGYVISASIVSINGTNDPVPFSNTAVDTLKKGLSGTYTINKTGTYGSSNFTSFTQAARHLNNYGVCGPVVINVLNGPYNERFVLSEIIGVSASNTIQLNGNGQEINFISDHPTPIVFLNGTDYLTIDNLTIRALRSPGYNPRGIMLKMHADYNTIKNCRLLGNNNDGYAIFGNQSTGSSFSNIPSLFVSDNSSYSVFDNNTINGWSYGIVMNYMDNGDDGKTISSSVGNRYTNNTLKNIEGYAFMLNNTDSALIAGNNISNPDSSTYTVGVYLAKHVKRSVIEKNRMHHIFDGAILQGKNPSFFHGFSLRNVSTQNPSDYNFIRNNLIYKIKGNGELYGVLDRQSINSRIYHNTFSFDDTSSTATTRECAAYFNNGSFGSDLANNIFSVTRGGTAKKYGIRSTGTYTSDYNVFNVSGSNSFIGNTSVTLADWQTSTGRDLNSIAADPDFLSPSSDDYHPTEQLINDIGLNLQGLVPDDIDGVLRPATPDPGAYEFGPAVPPTINTAVISPLTYCAGAAILVPFTSTGTFASGNVFSAQLSDASGSFGNPVTLGSMSSSVPGSASINGTIPITMPEGSAYRVRVVASEPSTTGSDNSQDILIRASPDAGVLSAEADTICIEGTVQLNLVGNTGGNLQWQSSSPDNSNYLPIQGSGGNTYSGSISQTTWFRVVASNATCSDTSNEVKVSSGLGLPVASFTYSQGDGYLINFTNTSSNGTEFFWNFGGASTTSENPSFTFPFDNIYPVTLIVSNTCGSDTVTVLVDVKKRVGIDPISEDLLNLELFPNPAEGMTKLSCESRLPINCMFRITDILGKVLFVDVLRINGVYTISLDLSSFSSGVYWVILASNNKTMMRKLIVM